MPVPGLFPLVFFDEAFLIRSLATSVIELFCETPSSSVSLVIEKNFGERLSQLCCAGRSAAGQMSFLRVQTRNQNDQPGSTLMQTCICYQGNISSHTPGLFSISDSGRAARVRLGDWSCNLARVYCQCTPRAIKNSSQSSGTRS